MSGQRSLVQQNSHQLRMIDGVAATRHVMVIKICPEKYALLEHAARYESDDSDAAWHLSCSPKVKLSFSFLI